MSRLLLPILLGGWLLLACDKAEESAAAAPPPRPPRARAAPKAPEKAEPEKKPAPEAAEHADGPHRFVVPFAWEASRDEPLSQARAYLHEIFADNRVYMEHGPKFFASFSDGQKPRATVVTCSDSRVHTPAFDATPENDDFMVRNIGNQVENGLGSIEYGVEHLQTPVLMILGHSGCGAVKAAMGDVSHESEPVRHELEKLHLSKPKPGLSPEAAWSDAVVENVRSQVVVALSRFGERVQQGQLTVIGAVYDFRNDLNHGAGKVTIVDVNGNGDPARMQAFVEAVEADAGASGRKKEALPARGKKSDGPRDNPEVAPALKQAIGRARELASQLEPPQGH